MVTDSKMGKLSHDQMCKEDPGAKAFFLYISNTAILVDNKASDGDAPDLTFDASVFSPLALKNASVYNTRRIAFEKYDKKSVFIDQVKLPSASDVPCSRANHDGGLD